MRAVVVSGGGARCFIRASWRDGDVVREPARVGVGWVKFDPSGQAVMELGWLVSEEICLQSQ